MFKWAILAALAVAVQAGTIVWNGSFNPYTTPSDFEKWSWANPVGTYQYYIHGSGPASKYLALDSSYKNPAHTSEQRGLRMTIDSTATWNSNMERIELIPQTTANLGTGQMYYHFSVKRTNTNAPDWTLEHQIMFFESHFTEIKYGVGNDNSKKQSLVWMIGGQEKWSTPFTADTWFNFAYDINFSAQTVGLWASTGSAPLQRVFNNAAASTSTNSADFHVGILRIVNTTPPEDWYVSGVYIESGSLTTSMGSGSGNTTTTTTVGGGTTTTTRTTTTPTTTTATTTTTTGPTQTQWGQCGGTGYTGPTTCASPYTCKAVSPPYYYQCQ